MDDERGWLKGHSTGPVPRKNPREEKMVPWNASFTGRQRVKRLRIGVAELSERRLSERNAQVLGDLAATLRSVHDTAAYRSVRRLHRYALWTQATITHTYLRPVRVTRPDYRRHQHHYGIISSLITPPAGRPIINVRSLSSSCSSNSSSSNWTAVRSLPMSLSYTHHSMGP